MYNKITFLEIEAVDVEPGTYNCHFLLIIFYHHPWDSFLNYFFSIAVLISVFRAANGHLISTIESKSTNPSGDAPKNVFSMSTNKPHEHRPVISSSFCFAFSSLSIPHCSDSGNF
jgi:hypothetical protein